MPPKLNAVLYKRIDVAPGLAALQIAPRGWEIPDFKPGQYCAMGLPGSSARHPDARAESKPADPGKLINRAYSVSSAPAQKDYLETYITMVPDGALSPRLFNLKVGDELFVSPKIVGHFNLDGIPDDANVILVSTGTGLAPYMSMLRAGLLSSNAARAAVIHGVRQSWDLGYREELEKLEMNHPRFAYIPTISRPQNEKERFEGRTGYVQKVWQDKVLDHKWGVKLTPENTHIFLCGGPGMIDDMIQTLQAEGFAEATPRTPGQIHVERYW